MDQPVLLLRCAAGRCYKQGFMELVSPSLSSSSPKLVVSLPLAHCCLLELLLVEGNWGQRIFITVAVIDFHGLYLSITI